MAFDIHKNLAISSVATAPTPATSGTSLTVKAGEGARFGAPPFNATAWPANAVPTPANAEVIRVTAVAGDVLTIARGQEGSTPRAIGTNDLLAATITAKTLTDLETQAALLAATNVFTGSPQTIQKSGDPRLVLSDTNAVADGRLFDIVNASQSVSVRALNDAQSAVLSSPLQLTRAGDAKVGRYIYERGRTTSIGVSETWTTSGVTVESGAIGGTVVATFAAIGQLVFIALTCTSFNIPAPTTTLIFNLPSKYPGVIGDNLMPAKLYVPGRGYEMGSATISSGYQVCAISPLLGTWPAGAGHLWLQGFYYSPN